MSAYFEVGDCVTLKSGGPPMMVVAGDIEGEHQFCTCTWFEWHDGPEGTGGWKSNHRAMFPAAVLHESKGKVQDAE